MPPRAETQGRTEECIGEWFARRGGRDRVILATKVSGRSDATGDWRHLRGGPQLSREQIARRCGIPSSVCAPITSICTRCTGPERTTNFFGQLGYRHREQDGLNSIEETLSALTELVREGLVRHIGISNEMPGRDGISARGPGARPGPHRQHPDPTTCSIAASRSVSPKMSLREQVGLLAYSPLAMAMLTGKYSGGARPEGARLTLFNRFQRYSGPQAVAASEAYVALARAHDLDPGAMALAFVNSREFVTSTIIGATRLDQLAANIASVQVKLSEEVIAGIEAIHRQYSNPAP